MRGDAAMSDHLNADYMKLKHLFLAKHAVMVNGDMAEHGAIQRLKYMPEDPDTYEFDLQHSTGSLKSVEVIAFANRRKKPDGKSKKVFAYWLPWQSQKAVHIDLGGDADYFFTSQLDGCQIRVAALKEGIRVIHVAGNGGEAPETAQGSLWRKLEAKKLLTKEQYKRSRRLSSLVSPEKETTSAAGYAMPDMAWTNVFGFRRNDQWELWTQIVTFDPDQSTTYQTINAQFWPTL
jgi:hypothetical protein